MNTTEFEAYSAEEWEHFRKRLLSSILVETEMAKLGQNANVSWPFKGSDETPAKYIEYDFEELHSVPGLVNKPRRVRMLMDILRETLAFDDPFSDMVEGVEAQAEVDDTFARILAKLGIPADFPAGLVCLEAQTAALVEAERIGTLQELIDFGQRLARNVVVGGDLRSFLNCLAHRDEKGISHYLPFRRGEKGLHLVQALGQAADRLPLAAQAEILHQTGWELTPEEEAGRAGQGRETFEAALRLGATEVEKVCQWFAAEARELENTLRSSENVDRFFITLNDPRRERITITLCRALFGVEEESEKSGFIGRIAGVFRR